MPQARCFRAEAPGPAAGVAVSFKRQALLVPFVVFWFWAWGVRFTVEGSGFGAWGSKLRSTGPF